MAQDLDSTLKEEPNALYQEPAEQVSYETDDSSVDNEEYKEPL